MADKKKKDKEDCDHSSTTSYTVDLGDYIEQITVCNKCGKEL